MGVYEVGANFMATDNMSGVIDGLGKNIASFASSTAESLKESGGAFSAFGAAAVAGIGLVGAALAIGAADFLETETAMAGMAARSAALPETLAQYKKFAENLESTGLVKNFTEAAAAVENLNKRVKGLGDHNTDEFLREVAGVGLAWDVSASKVVDQVGTIQKKFNELNGDPIKALDILTATAQNSGLKLDTINAVIDKYGGKFAAAGLSATDMGGLIVNAAQAGINTTSGLGALSTAVDTFHQKAMNPPAAFTAAMKDLGLGSVATDLKNNKITMEQALEAVFQKLSKIEDPAKASKDAIAIFGTGIDKIGGPEALGKLAGFSDALGGDKGIAGSAKKAADTMEALPSTSFTKVKTGIEDFLGGIVESASTALLQLPLVALWLVSQAGAAANTLIKGIGAWLGGVWDTVTTAASQAWFIITKGISDAAAGVGKAIDDFVRPINEALGGVLKIVNDILSGLGLIGNSDPHIGTSGQGGGTGHAWGATMDRGWNLLGENGPEMANSITGEVLTNRETNNILNMVMSGAGGGGGGKTEIHIHTDGATIVDMETFFRQVYVKLQAESDRRGVTT